MAKTADLTVEILKQIRDEAAATNVRLDRLNDRVDGLSDRLDGLGDRLDTSTGRLSARITEVEVRVATELVSVAHAVDRVHDLLKDRLVDRDRFEDHERRIAALERKAG